VPRLGTEAALTALLEGLAAGWRVCVFSGPPGLGKTMVLRVLAERLRGARCVHLPYAALALPDLAHWALHLLGEEPGSGDYVEALAQVAHRGAADGRALVLLLDDASALPLATARALRALVDRSSGALRLVATPIDDGRAGAAVAALGEGALHVRLRSPLSPQEVRAYVRERIARSGAAGASAMFDAAQIEWLAAESAGLPRVVNMLASWLLHRAGNAPGLFAAPGGDDALQTDDARVPTRSKPAAAPPPRRRRRLRRLGRRY
jgi:type II secretory pathway predicted ATPase ExeA